MTRVLKNSFRGIFAGALALLARAVIRKYNPLVVMVTGSVGKTSTKDAVAAALSENFFVRKSDKSFNSDFGVPLTILGVKNPWTHVFAWLKVFGEALALIFLPNHYPKLLVLEVGADRPGDLARILKIARPDAVVVTLLPNVPVHVEAYATPAAVREEEFAPAYALAPGMPLIFSADDQYAVKRAAPIDTHSYTFGIAEDADVRISDVGVWMAKEGSVDQSSNAVARIRHSIPLGMRATLHIKGHTYDLTVPGAFGRSQLFAPAAAMAAALTLGVSAKEALEGLKSYAPPPGRGRLFQGKKDVILIDDTYNSSPIAVEEILYSLDLIPHAPRKVAVLGDMLELGRYSVAEHARIGHIAKGLVDVLVTVGHRARAIGEAAKSDGMPEGCVHHFDTSLEAAAALEYILQEKDVVLVKGSQGIRMESIVRPLLADFADVRYLVRQDPEWLKR
jgi:UDP-N-acetylmuramoyl-tripeptide--D-alanyl-D-alanine ligase